MAHETSSLSFLRRPRFWRFVIGPAGAAGSVWGRARRGPFVLGHIVFILGLVLIAIGHGWAIDWAYLRFAGHHRHHQDG